MVSDRSLMRLVRTALLAVILYILFAFDALAITEYPWTGSEKDVRRAGGLGWVTVTEELVLPGTKECSVTIFQSGDERWGYMAGEEDPEEFHWTIKLYEEDNYSAKVQLPYSTYTTYYLGCNAIPEVYQCNVPKNAAVEWFPLNGLMLEETPHNKPEKVSSSCRLSEEEPEGELANDLIMVFKDGDSISYDRDISFLFKEEKGLTESESSVPADTAPAKVNTESPLESQSYINTHSFNEQTDSKITVKENQLPFFITGIVAAALSAILFIIGLKKKTRLPFVGAFIMLVLSIIFLLC